MKFFANLNIAKKMAILTAIAAISLGIVGLTGYYYLDQSNRAIEEMYRDELMAVKYINDARPQNRASQADILELIINSDPERKKDLVNDLNVRSEAFDKDIAALEKSNRNATQQKSIEKLKKTVGLLRNKQAAAIALAMDNKVAEASQFYLQECVPLISASNTELQELSKAVEKDADDAFQQSKVNGTAAATLLSALVLVSLLLIIIVGWGIARAVSNPLRLVVATVSEVAGGNLAVRPLAFRSHDETGQVAIAIDTMVVNLRKLIHQVADTAEQVAASAEELTASADQSAQVADQIAQSITDVASRAEDQHKATDATSSSVQQMSAAVQQVATNTNNVATTSIQATEAAVSGDRQVTTAVNQMVSIEQAVSQSAGVVQILGDRSKEIGQIVDTISGIAAQTNLLALNAAIEAARAGDAGRGFAVVAEEVRKLAEQSQVASKQIGELLGTIQFDTDRAVAAMNHGTQEVKVGTEVVVAAGQAFRDIVGYVNQVSSQTSEISAAMLQMAAGSQQVVSAIRDIDRASKETSAETQTVSAATQEQSATMEEIASASQVLARLAQDMQTAVQEFTV